MFLRRSLKWPIALGVIMIVLLAILIVGWVLLSIFGALEAERTAPLYWVMLPIGAMALIAVLVGVVFYLAMQIKAVNLNRRQSNFIDSVTHELKSPIASLKMYLQTLSRRPVGDRDREAFYRYMLEDLERLDRLVTDLLDVARLEKESMGRESEDVELAGLLAECADAVRSSHRASPETIHFELEPCIVRAPRADLYVLFRNLIDNAVKYAGSPPAVEISLKFVHGNEAVVRVGDNGPGIPPHQRRRIFRRFERLGSELERKKPGTGLGLYLVHTLVRKLRARIKVTDREPGPGAVFEVRLPGVAVEATFASEGKGDGREGNGERKEETNESAAMREGVGAP
jgi:two-component system phosphate regulon sensor histidine kinase PhoR